MKRYFNQFCFLMLVIILVGNSYGEEYSLINFGVVSGSLPSIEKSFDRELKISLSTVEGLTATDETKVAIIKKHSDFESDPVLSSKLVSTLRNNNEDKSLVVWVVLEELSIVPKRKALVTTIAYGKLRAKLYMYSLYFGEYTYSGEIVTEASVKKGIALLRPVAKVTHITAVERKEIARELTKKAITNIEDLVASITHSELLKSGSIVPITIKKERAPSVSDMFNIPSVEQDDLD